MKTVNICGIPHEIRYKHTIAEEDEGVVNGLIELSKCRITLKKGMTKEFEAETLFHEMIHGVLHHIGRYELAEDEEFVQGLANGLANSNFYVKVSEEDNGSKT